MSLHRHDQLLAGEFCWAAWSRGKPHPQGGRLRKRGTSQSAAAGLQLRICLVITAIAHGNHTGTTSAVAHPAPHKYSADHMYLCISHFLSPRAVTGPRVFRLTSKGCHKGTVNPQLYAVILPYLPRLLTVHHRLPSPFARGQSSGGACYIHTFYCTVHNRCLPSEKPCIVYGATREDERPLCF
jgi:hypothetical protein